MTCPRCNGSGTGALIGSKCIRCAGTGEEPDFEKMRRERGDRIREIARSMAKEMGVEPDSITFHSCDMHGCYCNCPDGPCEHEWGGWREFEDGTGGTTVCKHCGMDAMSHDIRVAY